MADLIKIQLKSKLEIPCDFPTPIDGWRPTSFTSEYVEDESLDRDCQEKYKHNYHTRQPML